MMSCVYSKLCLSTAVKEDRSRRSVLDCCYRPNTMKQEVCKEKPPVAITSSTRMATCNQTKSHQACFYFSVQPVKDHLKLRCA